MNEIYKARFLGPVYQGIPLTSILNVEVKFSHEGVCMSVSL